MILKRPHEAAKPDTLPAPELEAGAQCSDTHEYNDERNCISARVRDTQIAAALLLSQDAFAAVNTSEHQQWRECNQPNDRQRCI